MRTDHISIQVLLSPKSGTVELLYKQSNMTTATAIEYRNNVQFASGTLSDLQHFMLSFL